MQLLQMTVLPYVTVSLVRGLGSLGAEEAKLLGWRTGRVLLVFWALALGLAFLFPLAFPVVESASFFSTTLLQPRGHFDFLSLYIPANPFHSLANNVVPAVVLFSAALGVALIGVENKARLLDVLGTLDRALGRVNRFIVRLTPYGLFAIGAVQAGTLSLEELKRLEVYLLAYALVALLVSLWALPGLVAALTPIGHLELLRETRDALIMAFTTGSLFAVLPLLTERSQVLLRRHVPGSGADRLPEVIVPASFNFPHTGKLMSLSFILFAGWFSDAQVRIAEYPRLALTGLVTFFGSLNVAVPFLLDMVRIPADMFHLFLATGLISSRFGTLVAAMHTVALAVLGACAMSGALRFEPRRVGRWAILTAALAIVTLGGVRLLFGRVFPITYEKDKLLTEIAPLEARPPLAPLPLAAPLGAESGTPLIERIQARGRIRVGYLEDGLPFAFPNARGELVGFDVEMAHELAGVLGVELELVTVSRPRLAEQLERGECDVVMSGIAVTPDRARTLIFSESYIDETLALLVRDHRRHEFESWDGLRRRGPLRIASPAGVSYYEEKVHELLPEASVFHPQGALAELLGPQAEAFDAALITAERGSAWTLLYPRFSVVVPEGTMVKVPLAYPVAQHEAAFAAFLDTFIDLKRKDGTIDALYAHWILGRSAAARPRRWSILRDVLHWTE